jgi:hypothetical protein
VGEVCKKHGIEKVWRTKRSNPAGGCLECPDCHREWNQRYRKSPKGRETEKRYRLRYLASPHGKAARKRQKQARTIRKLRAERTELRKEVREFEKLLERMVFGNALSKAEGFPLPVEGKTLRRAPMGFETLAAVVSRNGERARAPVSSK